MSTVRVKIAGEPLRCGHCGVDVFRYEETRFETGRIGGLLTSTYVCVGCGFVHSFAEADGAKHLRAATGADVEPVECLSCGTRIPAGERRCPECGWSWAIENAEAPLGESL